MRSILVALLVVAAVAALVAVSGLVPWLAAPGEAEVRRRFGVELGVRPGDWESVHVEPGVGGVGWEGLASCPKDGDRFALRVAHQPDGTQAVEAAVLGEKSPAVLHAEYGPDGRRTRLDDPLGSPTILAKADELAAAVRRSAEPDYESAIALVSAAVALALAIGWLAWRTITARLGIGVRRLTARRGFAP